MAGPIGVPATLTTLAQLTIPAAGKYVIWGKAYFDTPAGSLQVTCRLVAGADFDESKAPVSTGFQFNLALNVVHEYAAAGTVDFNCATNTGAPTAHFIRITAIKVANLTNTG